MKSRRLLFVSAFLSFLLWGAIALSVESGPAIDPPDKALVTDGHVVHDLGTLQNHVTNWGLIGSRPGISTPFSNAPSARWNSFDYLYAAGFWLGGGVGGQRVVTTGQYASEFTATDAPGDTIFATAHGAPGGTRFPFGNADDDGDGFEDEDPLDGVDNDGDGAIDEDYAAIGDQSFRATMRDDLPEISMIYPDHTPMNVEIVQETYQWGDPEAADFIGYEYRVTNVGTEPIIKVYGGMFSDFDLGNHPDDDMVASTNVFVPYGGGDFMVQLAYMWDEDPYVRVVGYVGWVLCGVVIGGEPGSYPDNLTMHSFERFSGNEPFDQGGDPSNDYERYTLLSKGMPHDTDPPAGQRADYRFLISSPEIPSLQPGETVIFRYALVIGAGYDELISNTREAAKTAMGRSFDLDGDLFEEYWVPWMRPDDLLVPAVSGRLKARLLAGAVDLAFETPFLGGGHAVIDRRESADVPNRTWALDQSVGSITDGDDVGWPRTYDLKARSEGSEDLVLHTVEVPGPVMGTLRLEASPNPFNPRLTIRYAIPESGDARMEVLDLQGRVVTSLFEGHRSAGEDVVQWNGRDEGGRNVASGVYLVRLVAGGFETRQQVTLLR